MRVSAGDEPAELGFSRGGSLTFWLAVVESLREESSNQSGDSVRGTVPDGVSSRSELLPQLRRQLAALAYSVEQLRHPSPRVFTNQMIRERSSGSPEVLCFRLVLGAKVDRGL
jgi:hypothetical protein